MTRSVLLLYLQAFMTWTATTLHFVLVVVELIKKIRTELSSLKLPELREKGWDSSVGIVAKATG